MSSTSNPPSGAPIPLVAYLRDVSGRRFPTLTEQQDALTRVADARGLEIVRTFIEAENPDRPEIRRATLHARRIKGTLGIARLGDLIHDGPFLDAVFTCSRPLVVVDHPSITGASSDRFAVDAMAAGAKLWKSYVAERTRSGLAAAKAKGVLLGSSLPQCRGMSDEDRRRGAMAAGRRSHAEAMEEMADETALALQLRSEGRSTRQIAAALSDAGMTTRRGCRWSSQLVSRLLRRADLAAQEGPACT